MSEHAIVYFKSSTEKNRDTLKSIIREIHQAEKEADHLELELKKQAFAVLKDPVDIFHFVRLVEIIANIADDAQNTSDRMRTMIAR